LRLERLDFGRWFTFGTRLAAAKSGFAEYSQRPDICFNFGMEIKYSATVAVLLAGFLLTGCHKNAPQQKTSSPGISANSGSGKTATNTTSRDLGAVTLTNHFETCVKLGAGKDCVFTPKMIDRHNVQITVAVESKTASGKTHDLSVTQVITRVGKPFEVAVGNLSLSLTPNIAAE
jgi:hypothetical protein